MGAGGLRTSPPSPAGAPSPDYSDLRPARRAKNITLTTTAAALDVWPARVGELERGQLRNDDLATDCRTWLSAA